MLPFLNSSRELTENWLNAIIKTEGLRGLIIETFGSGNAPTYQWFLDDLKQFIDKGGIIFNVTQCPGGSVEMGLYETSRQMLAAGVISGKDITSEASVTKLMHLLGRYYIKREGCRIIENFSGRRNIMTGRFVKIFL